jgi:hypothetical protein
VVGLADPLVVWHRLLPAGGPSVAGVVELLLRLPEGQGCKGPPVYDHHQQQLQQQELEQEQEQQQGLEWQHEVRVSVGFRKRLVSVFQQPPDASRCGPANPHASPALCYFT